MYLKTCPGSVTCNSMTSIPPATSRDRIARHRAAQRGRGLRAVTLWLPDVNDPAYRARLAEECRRLNHLSADDVTMAAGFAELAARTEGWR
jgi:hypothetical protein